MELVQSPCWFPIFGGRSLAPYQSASLPETRASCLRTDEELMQCWQAGDPKAFGELYSRFADRLYRFVARTAPSRAEAEEICQEAWLAVIDGRTRYRATARFVTFLFAIAHRRSIDRLRSYGRRREQDSESHDVFSIADEGIVQPERIAHNEQNAGALLAAIDKLPLRQREAFLMQAEGGMSIDEIAEATESAREAVRSRLRYALRRLRATLAEHR